MKSLPAVLLGLAMLVLPAAGALAAPVAVSADFSQATGANASDFAFGLDVQDAFDPNIAGTPGNAKYKTNVAAMDAGIVRYHHANEMTDSALKIFGFSRGWVKDAAKPTCDWDEDKIKNAMAGSYAYGPQRMIDIVNWPKCMDLVGTKKLDPAKYQAYADFCARLVTILNGDLKLGITYFEVFNELDDNGGLYRYHMDTVATIYNMVQAAMKTADPTIKVGGPAFRQAFPTKDFDAFFAGAAPNLDFVTFHAYAYCPPDHPTTPAIYNAGVDIGATSAPDVAADFAKHSARHPEFFLDEFNMNCGGDDDRMSDVHSTIFDALTLINAVNAGTTGVMAWNEADDNYGKLGDAPYARFPAAYLYQAFNTQMRGTVYQSTPGGDAPLLVPLAVKSGTAYAIALVNRSAAAQHVKLTLSGIAGLTGATQFSVTRVNANGLTHPAAATYATLSGSTGYALPVASVTILSLPLPGP